MAMTAWAAKFFTSSICFSVNGPDFLAIDRKDADQQIIFEHWHSQMRPRSGETAWRARHWLSSIVQNVNKSFRFDYDGPERVPAAVETDLVAAGNPDKVLVGFALRRTEMILRRKETNWQSRFA